MTIKPLNKFKEGAMVASKEDPTIKLVVRRYLDRIYYCRVHGDPAQRERVYFERELVGLEPPDPDTVSG